MPRSPGHYEEWLLACQGGPPTVCGFDYAGPLTEIVLLGVLALRSPGQRLEWDGPNLQVANVSEVNQRLALYKRLAGAMDDAEVADLRAELADRFGPLPDVAERLLDIVRIRTAARRLGIEKLEAGEGRVLITFAPGTSIEPARLVRVVQDSRGRLRMRREFTLEAVVPASPWPAARDGLLALLREIGTA